MIPIQLDLCLSVWCLLFPISGVLFLQVQLCFLATGGTDLSVCSLTWWFFSFPVPSQRPGYLPKYGVFFWHQQRWSWYLQYMQDVKSEDWEPGRKQFSRNWQIITNWTSATRHWVTLSGGELYGNSVLLHACSLSLWVASFSESMVFNILHDVRKLMMTWMGTLAILTVVVLACDSRAQTCAAATVSENKSDDSSGISGKETEFLSCGSGFLCFEWHLMQNALHDCTCGTARFSCNDADQICELQVHNNHISNYSSGLVVCAQMSNCHHSCLVWN